ncbi:hypothetical protein [Frigoriglobus tundricola]|uniref:Uncharacterized protein n=1 Tax=Frigoriglobus tundricola TaxID=2774151 RepID=A0A6M5YF84_9BACT|nr:hypothetical protein [Frigoriglobus tundricola]QJW92667.1 hypothetical protein FTUN_0164 [Frigoriglobus tundricola]
MQFFTVRTTQNGEHRIHRQFGGRGFYGPFRFRVAPDPTVERVAVDAQAAPDAVAFWAVLKFLPNINEGIQEKLDLLAESGKHHCGIRVTLRDQKFHDVDTHSNGMKVEGVSFAHSTLERFTTPLSPLRADWLTSDVVTLARGIHADAAFDRLPILADALQDAGCNDPLVIEHLQTCPDHAPSCWVVEMILDQMARI